jgi:hypothetical protein
MQDDDDDHFWVFNGINWGDLFQRNGNITEERVQLDEAKIYACNLPYFENEEERQRCASDGYWRSVDSTDLNE